MECWAGADCDSMQYSHLRLVFGLNWMLSKWGLWCCLCTFACCTHVLLDFVQARIPLGPCWVLVGALQQPAGCCVCTIYLVALRGSWVPSQVLAVLSLVRLLERDSGCQQSGGDQQHVCAAVSAECAGRLMDSTRVLNLIALMHKHVRTT